MTNHVLYRVEDGIAVITLHRPGALNAFTDTMESQLIECYDRADADDEVRAVVLTGHGSAFCAGMDLSEGEPGALFESWRTSPNAPEGTTYRIAGQDLPLRRDGGGRVVLRMFESLKPIVAAINGHAIGVGLTMTLAADLRLAAETATFSAPFVRRGFVPESCSSWFLPRVVPVQRALDWMLTGRRFDAAEALSAGLVLAVYSADDVVAQAMQRARAIADNASPVSVTLTRRMVWGMLTRADPMDAHILETHALNLRGVSADSHEGVAAFLERRPPEFPDRVSESIGGLLEDLPRPPFVPVQQEIS